MYRRYYQNGNDAYRLAYYMVKPAIVTTEESGSNLVEIQ
jgi:hypothetical protein